MSSSRSTSTSIAGIRGTDPALIEAGRTLGLSRFGLVRNVVLPAAVPNGLVGLRYSIGVSWLILVFAETINATTGIGYLINTAREFFETDTIVLCLVLYALLGLLADVIVRSAGKGVAVMATDVHRDLSAPGRGSGPTAARRRGPGPRPDQVVRRPDRHLASDLDIEPGEFVVLLGASGCGKSTLLRILADLDRDITGYVEVATRRAVSFQSPRLMPWKKVWRNVVLGLPGRPDRARAEAALAEVGMTPPQ